MSEVPDDRCGYTWPEDFEPEADYRISQNSCCRKPLNDSEYCVWHAHPDDTNQKTIEALEESYVSAVRNNQIRSSPIPADGARLGHLDLRNLDSLAGISLREAVLTGSDLQGINLTEANLQGAVLKNTNLKSADLKGIKLQNADLTDAKIYDADLSGAKLQHAVLGEAQLQYSDLTGAKLAEATLVRANLLDSNLKNAKLHDTDLSGANLFRADLTGARLRSTTLSNAELRMATLKDTYLAGADLSSAELFQANLWGAFLYRADLTNTDLNQANLTEADLSNATLVDTSLNKAILTEANCQAVIFSGVDLRDAMFNSACDSDLNWNDRIPTIEDAQFEDGTDLRGADLSGAKLYQTAFRDVRINDDTIFGIEDGNRGRACRYDYDPNASVSIDDDTDRLRAAAWTYRRLESLFDANAMDQRARNAHIRKEEAQRSQAKDSWSESRIGWFRDYLVPTVSYHLHRHGESVSRLLGASAILIFVCGLLYSVTGVARENPDTTFNLAVAELKSAPAIATELLNGLYFSIITFSTIGYGDYYPASPLSQLLVGIESLAGAVFIALFVFVLGRRVAR